MPFETIYATDLVYQADCWQLCGDAHCCNFARYKSRFKLIARTPFQELPLLPGEYAFLKSRGWLDQFGDHDYKVAEFPIDGYTIKAESIVSRREGCACNHDTRPTICRLYPLLPRFDIAGRFIGTEPMGIYEEMEQIAALPAACQLTSIPFAELQKLLTITEAFAQSPLCLFYLEAYRRTKRHAADQLAAECRDGKDVFSTFEARFIRGKLVDTEVLRQELSELKLAFEAHYGEAVFTAGD